MGPRLAVPLIARARLTDRLDARRPLAVLRAPRGYGKTTLAAQWLRDRPAIGAWVDTPDSGGAAAFWPVLAQVLARAGVPVADLDRLPPEVAVERALRADGPPVHLVVDDLDHADDSRPDDELVDLLRRAPRLHLLVSVHERGRMRAGRLGDLDTTTLATADLLFTAEETAELAAAIAPELPETVAAAVHRECGGWPAITRAVLIELAGRRPVTGGDELVTATVDGVAREFLEERLRHEPNARDLVEFAVSTAPAEELSEPLVAELTDDPAAKLHLQAWVDAGVLLSDVDGGARVYRWPAAARRLFAAELDGRPERAARVHARLADAYLDERPAWALTHAVRARQWELVVRIIDTSWRTLIVEHRKRLYEAVTSTPTAVLRTSRRAMAMRDVMLQVPAAGMLSRDTLPADPESIDRLARSDQAPDDLDVALSVLVAFRNCADPEDARAVATRVHRFARASRVAQPAAVATLYPGVVAQVGAALLAAGDRAGAAEAYREVFRRADEGNFDYLARDAASKLALVHALDGDVGRSSAWLRRYEQAPPPSTWLTTYFESAADTAALLIATDRLEIRTAATISDRLAPPMFPDPCRGLYLYGRALLALHDGRAADLLDELADEDGGAGRAELAGGRPPEAALLAAARVDLLLALDRGNQARAALQGALRDHPALRVGHARLALLTGDHAGALRYTLDPQWERQAGMRSRQEMRLIHAVAAYRAGDREGGRHSLHRVAEAAYATGAFRPFVTVPREELEAMADDLPAVREVLGAEPLARHPDVFPVRVQVVTLTQRERLVLEKLASGLTLQQTADALVVSYNTIRSQQASIYHKLGVDSRADAIARARQWSLL